MDVLIWIAAPSTCAILLIASLIINVRLLTGRWPWEE